METELEAGPELDALVAEKVMGLTDWCLCEGQIFAGLNGCVTCHKDFLPDYSDDIAAAWEVIEKIKPHTWTLGWFEYFDCQILREAVPPVPKEENADEYATRMFQDVRYRWHHAKAESAPLAICRAALKAVSER